MWLLFAFLGPVSWAISTHIDKYLVDRYFRDADTAVLMLFTALMGVVTLPFIWAFVPGVFAASWSSILVMMASGVMYIAAMLFYLRAIQGEEASVVAPLFQLVTIFSFLLAWAMLGETLTLKAGAGAILIIGGILFVSLDENLKFTGLKPRVVFGMVICTAILALANVLFKFYAVKDDFWVTTFWTFVGEALFGIGLLCLARYRNQAIALVRDHKRALLGVSGANELVNLGGGLSVRYASLLAPVALVSAIASTTTLFVFAVGSALTVFAPRYAREDISRASLIRKGAAAVVVTFGVFLTGVQ
ncbi:drug/metabolite transporter (DMT)-like permease [Rhizomicrobium palustre]|uniref:Drug/metabolite transporter (DMT)-like permease n=1 Tax=Rhizomicrobium palustre TaxID=189966 RepID=A0A846N3X2_9PROT|nr:EamA family transporter [Rhizomicrobium palustre]NIK90313.1 drug/metabolite transporter (DMT)-like permease [Rhizomicrobium palustre]